MAFVSYEIPPEFKDEERWFKIFSMKSLKVFLGTGLIGLIIFKISEFLGLMILGIILGAAFCIGCTVLSVIPVAETEYMKGAGNTVAELLLKKFYRKRKRCILIKNYDDEIEVLLQRERQRKEEEQKRKRAEKEEKNAKKKKRKGEI